METTSFNDGVNHQQNPVHLGQDILLEVSKYLEPIDYSAVSKLFWRVAEDRAEALLKEAEDRCFGASSSDWSSLVGKTKWKLRMGFSVLEGNPNFQEDQETINSSNKNHNKCIQNAGHRKRKRCTAANGIEHVTIEAESSQDASLSRPRRTPLNLMASRLLWNRASCVPLASTKGCFNGPSAMLPDGKHIAFFDTSSLHIVVVDATAQGTIVSVVDAKTAIPSSSTATAAGSSDLRLFCSDNGYLALYFSHDSHDPLAISGDSLNITEDSSSSLSPPKKSKKLFHGAEHASRNEDEHCSTDLSEPQELSKDASSAISPQDASTSCWISVWKIDSSNTDLLEHQYLRALEEQDNDLPPIGEIALSASTGTVVLLRYHNNHSDDASGCDNDDCWIETLDISSGNQLARKQLASAATKEFIWNSQLSVLPVGNQFLATLYTSPLSEPEASTLRHFTFERQSLEILDSYESSVYEDDRDVFVQHAGQRILYFCSNRRHYLGDPKIVSSTGFELSITKHGRFSMESPNKQQQQLRKRWRLVRTMGDRHTKGLFEDPDEDSIVLDEVDLETNRRIRSISTGISRNTQQQQPPSEGCFLESVHCKRNSDDAFVVVSGVPEPDHPQNHRKSTILLRILSKN